MIKFIFFKILKWKIIGFKKLNNKCVLIAGPHTHWVDFFLGLAIRNVINEDIKFIGKKELFFFPLNLLMKFLGGIPVNRNSNSNTVDQISNYFIKRKQLKLAISPEGTRKKVSKWKTGFYYIAKKANVPIVSVSMDAKKKEVIFSKPFYPTENIDKDFAHLRKFYSGVVGIVPKNS